MPLKSEHVYPTIDAVTKRQRRQRTLALYPFVLAGRFIFVVGMLAVCAMITLTATQDAQLRLTGRLEPPLRSSQGQAGVRTLPHHHIGAPATGAAPETTADPAAIDLQIGFDGFGAVELTPRGPYAVDDVVTLVADPAPGHRFSHWSGALAGGQNPITFTVSGPAAITATFVSVGDSTLFTIVTNVVGAGAVHVSPPGPHPYGESANLTAVADPGWRFVRWSGDIGGNANPLVHTVVDNITATALFELADPPPPITVTVALETVGAGVVSVDPPGPYLAGQQITVTAAPDADWQFDGWHGHASGTANPHVMTLYTNTLAIAVFAPASPPPAPTVTMLTVGPGTAIVQPAGPYSPGQTVTLVAMPSPGASFAGWSGDVIASTNPHTFVLVGDAAITATFEQNSVAEPDDPEPDDPDSVGIELSVETRGAGQVERDRPGPYAPHQTVTLVAQPAQGWRFAGWGGALSGPDNPGTIVFTDETDEVAVRATFVEQSLPPLVVTVSAVGNGAVTADPPAPYGAGQMVTLTATPEANQCFLGWSGDLEGNTNPVTFELTDDVALAAEFGVCPLLLPMVAR